VYPTHDPRRLAALDKYLDGTVRELLRHDHRTAGLPVEVRFDQGVAHVTGELDSRDELNLVRQLVGRLAGVHAVWDRVRVGGREPVVLDLGCGDTTQYETNIGVDRRPAKAVAVIADLRAELPFAEGSADRVFAVHVLEHLPDYLPLLDECHRVLRPDGVLHVMAPWWRHVNSVADPTHLRLFDVQTVKGICGRPDGAPRWYPLHVSCDGASVFADLAPVNGDRREVDDLVMSRFFD
jgi:SAM-dependent methyltransferase